MASLIANQYSFFIVLISLLSSQATVFQRFSHYPASTTQALPEFIVDKNSYGLYGQGSHSPPPPPPPHHTTPTVPPHHTTPTVPPPPPSNLPWNYNTESYVTGEKPTTTPVPRTPPSTLPWNYNTESYVTGENPNQKVNNVDDERHTTTTNTVQTPPPAHVTRNYYQTTEQEEEDDRKIFAGNIFSDNDVTYKEPNRYDVNNYRLSRKDKFGKDANYNGDSYSTEEEDKYQQDEEDEVEPTSYTTNQDDDGTSFTNGDSDSLYKPNPATGGVSFPQGMSDTRTLMKGMYHYNLMTDKFNDLHPYTYFKKYRSNQKTNHYQQQQFPTTTTLDNEMP